MFNSTNVAVYICLCLTGTTPLLSRGCAQQQQAEQKETEQPKTQKQLAVELYVDAVTLAEAGENQKAIEKLDLALTSEKDFSLAYSLLGKIYHKTRNYEKSATCYEKAIELNPWSFKDYFNLGRVYEAQKDYNRAVRSYKRALEINGNNAGIMTYLAVAYIRTDRNNEAKELLTSVVQIQPDNNTAYQYLGYCCLKSKNVDKAVENYNMAIEINDKDWKAHNGLGITYILKGKNKDGTIEETLKAEAVRQWRLSLEINPNQFHRESLLKLIEKYSKQSK